MGVSNNLKITCTAEKAWGWTYMSISRYEGDSQFSLEFLGGVERKDEWPFIPIDSRMSDFSLHRDVHMVTLTLEAKYAMCEDKGRYLCEVKVNRTFFSKTFDVIVRKKPDPPELKLPTDIISGTPIWLITRWDAGYPVTGYLVHEIISGFQGLAHAARNERTTARQKDCAVIVENRYTVTPDISWNGTEILVRILPEKNITQYQERVVKRVRSDRKTFLVIDRKLCNGNLEKKVAHPYECQKYLFCYASGPRVYKCPEFHCFDARTRSCTLQAALT